MTLEACTAPRPKGDKRQRTRAALIEAAAALIAEKGYEQTTLENVAARAGMTRGAIYGNFRNRDELFLAVVRTRWTPIIPPLQPGASFLEQMRFAGAFVYRTARDRRRHAVAAAAFKLYALGQEDLRRRLARENGEIFRRIADAIAATYPRSALSMSFDQLARVGYALTDGLVFAYFADPESFPEEVFVSAFEALAA